MSADKRKFARQEIDLVVSLEMADASNIRCDLVDVSQGGARLKVRHPDHLPEQFKLEMSNKVARWCRVAWRSAGEVGVEFLAAPQPPADKPARRAVMIRCPKSGKSVQTGIRLTTPEDLAKIANGRRFTQCSHCKLVHGWIPKDAFLQPLP